MKLTKQLIKRFEDPEITVREINGTFMLATATVRYSSGKEFRVEVYRCRPELEQYGGKNRDVFYYPDNSNSGTLYDVPPELKFVIPRLEELAHMSDLKVIDQLRRLHRVSQEFCSIYRGTQL